MTDMDRRRLGCVHVNWGASGLPTIHVGTHKLLRIPPLVPTSHRPHNVTSRVQLYSILESECEVGLVLWRIPSPHTHSNKCTTVQLFHNTRRKTKTKER